MSQADLPKKANKIMIGAGGIRPRQRKRSHLARLLSHSTSAVVPKGVLCVWGGGQVGRLPSGETAEQSGPQREASFASRIAVLEPCRPMSLAVGARVPSSISPAPSSAEATTGTHLTLLGGFQLRHDRQLVALPLPAERLLAFVALHDRPLLRPYIAGMLWSEATEGHAAGNLRCALWRLTHCGARLLKVDGGHLRLAPHVSVDIRLGTTLALRLRNPAPVPEADLTADNLSFDLLPDWYEEWVILAREAFCQLRVHALEAVCERLVEVGKFDPAVQAGLAAVAADPLRESAHRVLIVAHLAEGNAGPALRQFETFSRLLEDELGLAPSAPMQELAAG